MAKSKKSVAAPLVDQSRPFLGLRSFEEKNKDQFGGRDQEIRELFRLVEDHKLTVVFGTSGIGKTSLIKAGLLPELRKRFYFPIYIRIDYSSSKKPLLQLRDHIFHAMHELDRNVKKLGKETTWEYLHEVNFLNGLVVPVLIFDQFEEIFTLGENKSGIKEFITELSDLAQNRIPASVKEEYAKQGKTVPSRFNKLKFRVVISLREDYLAKLDALKSYIPSILDNGFRVIQMDTSQAMEAAIKPGKGLIDTKVAGEIIKKLPGVSQSGYDLFHEPGTEQNKLMVEPFLLSLICQRLNEQRIKQNLPVITSELVAKFKVDGIITSFYEDTIREFDPRVDLAIQEELIDAEGYRKLNALLEFQNEYDISDEVVNELIDKRIVRKENRNNVEYLELIHDVLAPVIKKRRGNRIEDERQKAKQELDEKNRKRWKRRLIFTASALVLIGILTGVYVYLNFREKQKNIWDFAVETNSVQGYRTFRNIFPKGSYDNEAKNRIESMLSKDDDEKWEVANKSNTVEGFQFYIDNVDQLLNDNDLEVSQYVKLYDKVVANKKNANEKIKELNASNASLEKAEQDAWSAAIEADTFKSYLNYIQEGFLNNRGAAKEKLLEKGNSGWLFSGWFEGNRMINKDRRFKIDYRYSSNDLNPNSIPQADDIVSLRDDTQYDAYRAYELLQNINNRSKTNYPLVKPKQAYVLQSIKDGEALLLKVLIEK